MDVTGVIHHNVLWDMNTTNNKEAIKVKGDTHRIFNNILVNIANVGIGVPALWQDAPMNGHTITRNNAARWISAPSF